MPPEFILEASIQHTGTRFLHSLIFSHPSVDATTAVAQVHTVLKGTQVKSRLVSRFESISKKSTTLMHMHVWAGPTFLEWAVPLMMVCPTVMPMRDPLASLVSVEFSRRQKSLPKEWISQHVDAWENWIHLQEMSGLQIFNFPIDTPMPPEGHVAMTNKMLAHIGLVPTPRTTEYALAWNPVGGRRAELKSLYLRKDLRALQSEMPETLAGIRKLLPKLRPHMERLGYKDLFWW